MKNFIICLSSYPKSLAMAQLALESGQQHGWQIELFEGINGLDSTLRDFDITINQQDAKCRTMMERPGVQGCLLSHWLLWAKCVQHNDVIGIFEHDVKFLKPFDQHVEFSDVLKLEGFDFKKPRPAGNWYEGTRGYLITPAGADKLLSWIDHNGCLPSDVQIGTDIVDIQLCTDQIIIQQDQKHNKQSKREQSFTWNLENIAL